MICIDRLKCVMSYRTCPAHGAQTSMICCCILGHFKSMCNRRTHTANIVYLLRFVGSINAWLFSHKRNTMRHFKYIALLCLFSGGTQAYYVDGNALVGNLKEFRNAENENPNTDYTDSAKYVSYVLAVTDALVLNGIICTPVNSNVRQVTSVVAKYLEDQPERWSEPAYYLVFDALKSSFPCPDPK